MVPKSIDNTFIQYGVRKDDLSILEILAEKHHLDFGWLQTLFRSLNTEKLKHEDIDEKTVERLIESQLNNIRTDGELKFYK
jgi:hypothetical protein